jgi:broad specificity phosphatase PhoE
MLQSAGFSNCQANRGTMKSTMRRMIPSCVAAFLLLLVLHSDGAAAAALRDPASPDTFVTTIILVRHAEKNPHPPGGDSGLSVKGMLRAKELARVVKDSGIEAIYASQFARARMTAEPLAHELGDSVRTYDANHIEALVRRVRRDARRTVLIVGHSDTIPETFEDFTGQRMPEKESIDYDRLYVLTLLGNGKFRLLRLRYGEPSQ